MFTFEAPKGLMVFGEKYWKKKIKFLKIWRKCARGLTSVFIENIMHKW